MSAYAELREAVAQALAARHGYANDELGQYVDARDVLAIALPMLADLVRQASYRVEHASRDFGPAVHPDFAGDWIEDLLEDEPTAASNSRVRHDTR